MSHGLPLAVMEEAPLLYLNILATVDSRDVLSMERERKRVTGEWFLRVPPTDKFVPVKCDTTVMKHDADGDG